MTAALHAVRRLIVGTGETAFTIVGVAVLAFGIPLFWLWVASQISPKVGAVDSPVIAFMATGILVSYFLALVIAGWLRGRLLARYERPRPRRQSWNRSMRDTPYRPGTGRGDPIERIFVATAIVSMVAFGVWFAVFASAPNPG